MTDLAGLPVWALIGVFVLGLVLIVKGGDFFVDAAAWMAEVSGIPHFIIGATVVSLATTLPEVIVSCFGAARGSSAIAIGNAVGTITSNTGLIMAISIIFMPVIVKRSQYAFKSIMLLLAVAVLYLSSIGNSFSKVGGGILLLIFAVSVYESVKSARAELAAVEKTEFKKKDIPINLAKFVMGAAGIAFGADFLVGTATEMAIVIGVPEAVISATVVAIGTSLPELVTTITSIVKKQSALSVGNIIGANLIDATVILPVCSLISKDGLTACRQNLLVDFPVCLGLLGIALIPMLIFKRFTRAQGVFMLVCYISYLAFISLFKIG